MKPRQIVSRSAVIGGLFGVVLAVAYGLFVPAASILWNWRFESWPWQLADFGWIPYTIIIGLVVGGFIGCYLFWNQPFSNSFRVGITLLAAMVGAGIGTGPLLVFWILIFVVADMVGVIVGMIVGAIFGGVLAFMTVVSGSSFEDQLLHPLRLRILAAAIPGVCFVGLYLGYHYRQGAAPANGWPIDYLIVPTILAVATMCPTWLFGPDTRNFYLNW
jgi:hypothetical protein